jgi:spore maturation protein CgeB
MIKSNCNGNYGYDPMCSYDFTGHVPEGVTLYLGNDQPDCAGDTNKKVRFYLETPNFLYIYNSAYDNQHFDLVYLICPYSCNYLNELYNTNKFKCGFYPNNDIRIENPKTIDVFYTGHYIQGLPPMVMSERAVIRKIGNQFHELKEYISPHNYDGFCKKMEVISKVKIYLVHNLLISKHNFPNYYSNDLTRKHLPWDFHDGLVPQMKGRMFEGALMGCILLAYKDEHKIIERFFTENEEFIYFENEEDLNSKIDNILANYDKYKHIGENAQKRARENYLTKHLAAMIVKDLKELNNGE